MKKKTSTTLLASFATIKSLSDARKYQSSYQILAEFIRDIIISESLHAFHAPEMKSRLNSRFEFNIPEAVVKTSLRKMPGISLNNGVYLVSEAELGVDSLLKEKNKEADDTNASIISFLVDYVKSRECETVNIELLTQDLIAFLVDDSVNAHGKYTDYISEFILKNEKNSVIQDGLTKIKEGSILYMGLSHTINEIGSITKPLTLFLGTEILFSLVGLNGEIYTQLAKDFFEQVRNANITKPKSITLVYFSDVKKEIDDYFFAAQEVVEGKHASLFQKPAMIAITNGCTTAADVRVKQSDFYHRLQYQYGIVEDSNNDYYNEELFKTNLESVDFVEEEDKAKKKEMGIKFVSHINKLRGSICGCNELESGYLLVTNSKTTLFISKEQADRIKEEKNESVPDFAVSLDRITSLLWYKLGNGFGNKEYPANVNAVLKARVVLSSSIAKSAEAAFSDTKKQFSDGTITEEQLAARIITLRRKPILPEELQGDDIAEIMDFSSEYLSRYEEKVNSDRKALEEKENVIKALNHEKDTAIAAKEAEIKEQADLITQNKLEILEKDSTIAQQQEEINSHISEKQQMQVELDAYRAKEAEATRKRNHRKRVFQVAKRVLTRVLISCAVLILSIEICKRISPTTTDAFGLTLGVLGLLFSFMPIRKEFGQKSSDKQATDISDSTSESTKKKAND